MLRVAFVVSVTVALLAACEDSSPPQEADAGLTTDAPDAVDAAVDAEVDAGDDGGLVPDGPEGCGTPTECGAAWEQRAAERLAEVVGSPEIGRAAGRERG